jgi:SAM-dependent methyltransferase
MSETTPASHHAFYDDAHAYDVAFSYRDVDAELAFLLRAAERHGKRGAPKSFLELASGPGYHAVAAAQRGLRSIALDLSGPMVHRAKEKAEEAHVQVTGIVADMARFSLSDAREAPVDLACNLLTSISYLLDTTALHAHFASVARALEPGGVYVVENNHPNDFWTRDHFQPSRWTMQQGDVEVFTSWVDEPPSIDVVRQTYSVACRTEVRTGGEVRTLCDRATLRMIWPQEMRALGEAHGLTLAALYGAMDDAVDANAADAWRAVYVFVKGTP